MIQGEITKERMEGWKFDSSCEEGFHEYWVLSGELCYPKSFSGMTAT